MWLDMYFYVRQHILQCVYGTAIPSICQSVCSSVCYTRGFYQNSWTAAHIIEILSLSDKPMILVFVIKGCCVNRTVSPITGAPNTMGVAIFNQRAATSMETVIDRGIFTVEDVNSYCALSRSAALDDLELPRTLVSRPRYGLMVNISQTVHDPLHIWF